MRTDSVQIIKAIGQLDVAIRIRGLDHVDTATFQDLNTPEPVAVSENMDWIPTAEDEPIDYDSDVEDLDLDPILEDELRGLEADAALPFNQGVLDVTGNMDPSLVIEDGSVPNV